MSLNVDRGGLAVLSGKSGIDPGVGDDPGVDLHRIRRIIQAGIHRGEGTDVAARAGAAGDDAGGIDAKFTRVLLEPADGRRHRAHAGHDKTRVAPLPR